MCELFGLSSRHSYTVGTLLAEFYSHSEKHPNGWGLAIFDDGILSVEKEPIRAIDSSYLKERLYKGMAAKSLIAHIRKATMGSVEFKNCHPFVAKDNYGRHITFEHNGTMFEAPYLDSYFYVQNGQTDSERVLLYFIDRLNEKQYEIERPLTAEERFNLFDSVIAKLTVNNKVNLLFYDGELMYAHTNHANSLYIYQGDEEVLFSTTQIGKLKWQEMPINTLVAYKDGERIFTGKNHGNEYFYNENDMKFLYLNDAAL